MHSFFLENSRLKVQIHHTDEPLPSQRFDPSARVEQVTLDGKHTFCIPEQIDASRRSCYGTGLCGEFVWDELGTEVLRGEWFPKIGIGLLQQTESSKPYDMWKRYEVVPNTTTVEFAENSAVFHQVQRPCLGISAELWKKIELHENMLCLSTTIVNTGERDLTLNEYQHNFVAIDGEKTGPAYELTIPFDGAINEASKAGFRRLNYIAQEFIPSILSNKGTTVLWPNYLRTGEEFYKRTDCKDILLQTKYFWELKNHRSGAAIREFQLFAPTRFDLWGVEHCICPEVYTAIHVKPGEKQSWWRVWQFIGE